MEAMQEEKSHLMSAEDIEMGNVNVLMDPSEKFKGH